MKVSDLEDLGSPITEQEIRDFERRLGAALPKDYFEFLLRTNGGHVPDDNGYFYIEESEWLIRANFFYGLRRPDVEVYELGSVLTRISEKYPETFGNCYKLPVAADDFGNKFYISLQGSNCGSIYYWMHGGDGTDDDFIRDSFSAFLESLSKETN